MGRAVAGACLPVGQGRLPAQPDCPQNPGAEPLLGQLALSALKHEQNSNDRLYQDRVTLFRLNQGQLQDLVPPQKQLGLFLHGAGGRPRRKTQLEVASFRSCLIEIPHLNFKYGGHLVLSKLWLTAQRVNTVTGTEQPQGQHTRGTPAPTTCSG